MNKFALWLVSLSCFQVNVCAHSIFDAVCPSEPAATSHVVIIGGGASATYAAIRLSQLGQTVTLIEQQESLGGHVNTFRDTATGQTVDYGVISYGNTTLVRDFFDYLDVPLAPRASAKNFRSTTVHANIQTDGKVVTLDDSVPWANRLRTLDALRSLRSQLALYPFLDNGFDLPAKIPEDLLLPFGLFAQKYDLEPIFEFVFIWMGGLPNILEQTTLYILKSLSLSTVDALVGGSGTLTTAKQNNQELYDKATERLAGSVFLQSDVDYVSRDDKDVHVGILTSSGRKLIKAKKLLVAIPPLASNLQHLGMELSPEEQETFGQFKYNFYWVMMVRNSGIPDDVSVATVDITTPSNLRPGLFYIAATGIRHHHIAYYSSAHEMSDQAVKVETLEHVARVANANAYPSTGTPEIVAFTNHSPYGLVVSAQLIQDGFYDRMNNLQGNRNTYWTGAAWQAPDSTLIWNWTEHSLLPKLVAS
ncbi:hypothetical protein Hte_008438 [Hypoxylon texense]